MVFSHVIRGHPVGLFQFSGGGSVRIIWASAMCPNMERRCDWIIAVSLGCLVILLTSSLQTNWRHLIPGSVLNFGAINPFVGTPLLFTGHFSGRVEQSFGCVCVCVCVYVFLSVRRQLLNWVIFDVDIGQDCSPWPSSLYIRFVAESSSHGKKSVPGSESDFRKTNYAAVRASWLMWLKKQTWIENCKEIRASS